MQVVAAREEGTTDAGHRQEGDQVSGRAIHQRVNGLRMFGSMGTALTPKKAKLRGGVTPAALEHRRSR